MKIRAERSYIVREVILPVQSFLHTPKISGMLLFAASVVAMVWANSPWAPWYDHFWETRITIDTGILTLSADLRHWVNDGLMTIFFFVVGLEVKREIVQGTLSGVRQATLPAVAALGGMLVPALCYLTLNVNGPGMRGWGVPMATDIAFALGVLALLETRIPSALRLFLLALAIVDDIGAILVIAVFYTQHLALDALAVALGLLGLIIAMKRVGVLSVNVYIFVGVLFWAAVWKSGVHATIAGVVLGLVTPLRPYFSNTTFAASADTLLHHFREALSQADSERAEAMLGQMEELSQGTESPLGRIERRVHPWSSYVIMPLFALANAGLTLSGDVVQQAASSAVTWGILAGLLVGKLAGIVGCAWLAVRLRLADLPSGVQWPHMAGIGSLAGIGFTMAIFIAGIAFEEPAHAAMAKIGILTASVVAGLGGYTILRASTKKKDLPQC
jgi:NhaA family Na+:H+ antiporter